MRDSFVLVPDDVCLWAQGEKIKCLTEMVTHLKLVDKDKHAIKNFDRELERKNCKLAKAVAAETELPAWFAAIPVQAT